MSLENHGIYTNLRGTVCACDKPKLAGKSFCRRCYFALPKELQNALYIRESYPETFRRALQTLGLKEPEGPQSLAEVFPPRLTHRLRRR